MDPPNIFDNLADQFKEKVKKDGEAFLKKVGEVVGGASSKEPWEDLAHCFVVDYDELNFVKIGARIFDLVKDDIDQTPKYPKADAEIKTVSTEEEIGKSFASDVGIKASQGCFSGSASMGLESNESNKHHTMRVDSKITATKFSVSAGPKLKVKPETFVDADIQRFITEGTITMEELEGLVGHFFCRECELGGVFQKSYIMEMSAADTSKTVKASLQASYGLGLMSAEAKMGLTKSTHNANASVRIKVLARGGDPTIWTGLTKDNFDKTQEKWAASITDNNVFPVEVSLEFVWEIVKAINPKLGETYQDYLVKKWGAQPKVDIKILKRLTKAPYQSFKSKSLSAYMYTNTEALDSSRYFALCWMNDPQANPKNFETMRWKIIQFASEGTGDAYVGIKSLFHAEKWLCSGDGSKERDSNGKKYALVWRNDGNPTQHVTMRWTIKSFGNHVGIKSVHFNEWLCASKDVKSKPTGRACYTRVGDPDNEDELLWTLE